MSVVFDPTLPGRPAHLGGIASFEESLPLVRPTIPGPEKIAAQVEGILSSGKLTNGLFVRELEHAAAEYLGVKHCVAVSSCTAGLMLILRAAGVTGDVIIPSFTFSATAHAVQWNGLRPVCADIDEKSLTLAPQAVERAITDRTGAILAVHTYGTPCRVDELAELARRHGLRLFFDAAHAFGSRCNDMAVGGFGDAEVFSLSPTKVLVAGEGGLITTNDDILAEGCRIGRDYGNPGDYNCIFVGLNARMSEVHAATGLASLGELETQVVKRNDLAAAYRRILGELPGLAFPELPAGARSTYKDFTITVDPAEFGLTADELATALAAENIDTRRYYVPPIHTMKAYISLGPSNGHLPITDKMASMVLTLPMFSTMTEDQAVRVGQSIRRIREHVAGSDID